MVGYINNSKSVELRRIINDLAMQNRRYLVTGQSLSIQKLKKI